MKHLLTVSTIALTITASAQCTLSRNEVDPFTGAKVVSTKLGKAKASAPGYALYVSSSNVTDEGGDLTTLSLYLLPSPRGCVTSTSKAIFLWPDGGTETLMHEGGIKCSNQGHIMVVQDDTRIIKENPSAVRLYFSEGYVDVTLTGYDVARHILCALLQ